MRKQCGFTQEQLAELCSVSRQSVAKWESGNALPELEKLIVLSKALNISTDILLKDELSLNGAKAELTCCSTCSASSFYSLYEGTLVKESIEDENILDHLTINNVEIWKTNSSPKYWTMIFFSSSCPDLPERFARTMKSNISTNDIWFVDFKCGNVKYIVFRDTILSYTIGNPEEKNTVIHRCRELGITDNQMNWSE